MRDALRIDCERASHLRGPAPLAGVNGDAQPSRASRLERLAVEQGIGVGGLGAGEVPAGQAAVTEAGRRLGQSKVVGRVVGAKGGRDQSNDRAGRGRPRLRAADDRLDPIRQREPSA